MTSKEKIEELQRRLDKLKGKEQREQPRQQTGGLGQQFEEMGKSFQGMGDNIPRVKLGRDKPRQPIQYDPKTTKLRRIVLYILVALIGGGAFIMIISRIIKRFILK